MEMLALLLKEIDDDRETVWRYADAPVGEALELVGGVRAALSSMYTLLDHIGDIHRTQASTSGVTPLMSP